MEEKEAAELEVQLLQVRTLVATSHADMAPICTGDHHPGENLACKYNTDWWGCVYSPGCNWGGQSYFGGWCTGGSRCVYLPSTSICSSVNAGCLWVKATWPLGEPPLASSSTPKIAGQCAGDGSVGENEACQYNPSWTGCVHSPGCNWAGQTFFGGWCVGGPRCVYLPSTDICLHAPDANCTWVPSAVPLDQAAAAEEASKVPPAEAHSEPAAMPAAMPAAVPGAAPSEVLPPAVPAAEPAAMPAAEPAAMPPAVPVAVPAEVPAAMPAAEHTAMPPAVPPATHSEPASSPAPPPINKAANAPPSSVGCTGDGSAGQNMACRYNPTWSGCVYSPGCNWNGQSYFGGWCQGNPRCVYLSSTQVCNSNADCRWIPATVALDPAAAAAEAADAVQSQQAIAAAWNAAASRTDAEARAHSFCFGDGTFSENPMCKYSILWGSCVLSAGCNWHGQSALGGWCTGGFGCTYVPSFGDCVYTLGCRWTPPTAALVAPMAR